MTRVARPDPRRQQRQVRSCGSPQVAVGAITGGDSHRRTVTCAPARSLRQESPREHLRHHHHPRQDGQPSAVAHTTVRIDTSSGNTLITELTVRAADGTGLAPSDLPAVDLDLLVRALHPTPQPAPAVTAGPAAQTPAAAGSPGRRRRPRPHQPPRDAAADRPAAGARHPADLPPPSRASNQRHHPRHATRPRNQRHREEGHRQQDHHEEDPGKSKHRQAGHRKKTTGQPGPAAAPRRRRRPRPSAATAAGEPRPTPRPPTADRTGACPRLRTSWPRTRKPAPSPA